MGSSELCFDRSKCNIFVPNVLCSKNYIVTKEPVKNVLTSHCLVATCSTVNYKSVTPLQTVLFTDRRIFNKLQRFKSFFLPVVYASDLQLDENDTYNLKKILKEQLEAQTPMERLKQMYSLTPYDRYSPELSYVMFTSYLCGVVGGLLGAVSAGKKAADDFFRKNVATQFESEYLAKRKLSDQITLAVFKNMFSSALKYWAFSGIYTLVTITAATYNNKVTIYEHIGAGALAGGLVKIKFGLKGFAAASVLGGILGLTFGGLIIISMRIGGIDFADFRYYQHEYNIPRVKEREKGKS